MPSSAVVKCENVLLDYFLALYNVLSLTNRRLHNVLLTNNTNTVNSDFSEMRVITIMDVVRPRISMP